MGTARRILRGTIRFDREEFKLHWGLRFALGVGLPLFIGAATGYLIEGVAIAGGALTVGLTDSGAPYRGRVRAMLITCVVVAVCTFVGELAGRYGVIVVPLLALASLGAGMFISMGLPTYFVALMAPLTITVVSNYPTDAPRALERAGLVFVGGLFAVALVALLWGAHAHLPERKAIAKVYRSLARWLAQGDDIDDRRPVLLALGAARDALDAAEGSRAVGTPAGEAFRVLVDEADRTYLDLVALRNARTKIAGWSATIAARAFAAGRDAAADALVAVADGLETGRWHADLESLRERLDTSVSSLRDELDECRAAGDVFPTEELEEVLTRGASLRGELRGAVDLVASWQGERAPPEDPVRHRRPRRPELGVRRPGPILRANLTLRSSAFRHAVRLSLTIAIAATIERGLDLPRGYWVPLTVLFVLRPDFGATFTRGLARYAGTVLGVVLATLIAAAFHPGPYALAALITVLSFAFCAFLFANYMLFTLSITACIIFFVAFAGPHTEMSTALDRLLDTAIGATLTLGIYALWPTWEHALLPETTAELIEADRGYVRALFHCWFAPDTVTPDAVRAARVRARIARTNTEASVQRALLEPAGKRVEFGTARATGILTSLRRFADGALALEAYLEDDRPAAPPEAKLLADQIDAALAELAQAARDHRDPGPLPPLRQTQQALTAQVGLSAPLAEESDRMVNSLVIAAHVLARPESHLTRDAISAAGVPAAAAAAG